MFECKPAVQVLRKNHPGIALHGDLRTLDLTVHAAEGKRLDVVVITTPCVDVSARGRGLAQQGQVRAEPRAFDSEQFLHCPTARVFAAFKPVFHGHRQGLAVCGEGRSPACHCVRERGR
jgi:site-specific DNA-cytosine methylase